MKVLFEIDPRQIENDVDNLYPWSFDSGLIVHCSKCKILPFGTSSFEDSFILGDSELPVVDKTKDLGFMITHNLSWNSHIDHELATARKLFGWKSSIQLFFCQKETALLKSYFVRSTVQLSYVVSLFHVYCKIRKIPIQGFEMG